ncbi:MAG: SdpI family protein [Clostridia bacterium]|nr:SdpI family protein [Clostridia bacterium]
MMIRRNKTKLILTSVVILIPIIIGMILWNQLPDTIATHWGENNQPNGFSSKIFAVFGMPAVLLGIHWLCMIATTFDKKSKNMNPKVLSLVLWICPALSLLMSAIVYLTALGKEIKVGFIVILFMGLLFIIIGNYLPKCKQSYTMGIKLPWTLKDEENWNKTHRFAGPLWVIGGVVIMATAIFESPIVFGVIVGVMVITPVVYSYLHYKNNR